MPPRSFTSKVITKRSISTTTGSVAYYPFDNNTLDYSSNDLDGSKVGGLVFSTDRFNETNASVSFSGTSEYITVAHDAKLDLDNLTISAWVNIDTFRTSPFQSIVSKFQCILGATSPILLRLAMPHSM